MVQLGSRSLAGRHFCPSGAAASHTHPQLLALVSSLPQSPLERQAVVVLVCFFCCKVEAFQFMQQWLQPHKFVSMTKHPDKLKSYLLNMSIDLTEKGALSALYRRPKYCLCFRWITSLLGWWKKKIATQLISNVQVLIGLGQLCSILLWQDVCFTKIH